MDELPDSVLKVRQFWKNTCYRIADHIFSLDDIEHGILRGESTEKSRLLTCTSTGKKLMGMLMSIPQCIISEFPDTFCQ